MREKELRLALICYGGISLAVYMHGVTKEIWRLVRASRAEADGAADSAGVERVYRSLLSAIGDRSGTRLRVFVDIVAGASAGGMNGIFLSRAVATGESLDPLTDLWLDKADVTVLLDPDARPISRFTKFWAVPLAWMLTRTRKTAIDTTVELGARGEVRAKLSQFVRARWFAPPFGGEVFIGLLLDAFDAMMAGKRGPVLMPRDQPIDLTVTATDLAGFPHAMRLHSPPEVEETEHRLTLSFRDRPGGSGDLSDAPGLAFAARATASFPGAFPPFTVAEMDRALKQRGMPWPGRAGFLQRQLGGVDGVAPEDRVLVDGSVLANAPFRPAIAALRQRPARREVDRRFIYIDPKPGRRSFSIGRRQRDAEGGVEPPGWMTTILKTLSDIPREQPIHDNVDALTAMSSRIARIRTIVEAMRPEVEERIEVALGRAFFLDRPTPARLAAWRRSAQTRAMQEAGYGFLAYGHLKLSLIVEELGRIAAYLHAGEDARLRADWRGRIWAAVRARGLDRLSVGGKEDAAVVTFLRAHDVTFRIRRLRFLARRLDEVVTQERGVDSVTEEAVRAAIYESLGAYLDRESRAFYDGIALPPDEARDAAALMDAIALRRNLELADSAADERLAEALALLPRPARRAMIHAYLGFAFFDAATLPLLQGDVGEGEFDPIKIDRISPDDATALRSGGAEATLKGIQFNSFGAFFSRAFRENDYLWGRLHAAERLISIVASAAPAGVDLPADTIRALQRDALRAILDEEVDRLRTVPGLVDELRAELG